MYKFIYRVCHRVWQEEKMPENWIEAIIITLHKKEIKQNATTIDIPAKYSL